MSASALDTLLAKEAIRELGLTYARGVDRKDFALLRTLYTEDGTDAHGVYYDGGKEGYVDFLETTLVNARSANHFICNHLISVDGEEGEGEVYAIATCIMPAEGGGWIEILDLVRYLDRYRVEDGAWRFASRTVMFDHSRITPIGEPLAAPTASAGDPSYALLRNRLFGRGGAREPALA